MAMSVRDCLTDDLLGDTTLPQAGQGGIEKPAEREPASEPLNSMASVAVPALTSLDD